ARARRGRAGWRISDLYAGGEFAAGDVLRTAAGNALMGWRSPRLAVVPLPRAVHLLALEFEGAPDPGDLCDTVDRVSPCRRSRNRCPPCVLRGGLSCGVRLRRGGCAQPGHGADALHPRPRRLALA